MNTEHFVNVYVNLGLTVHGSASVNCTVRRNGACRLVGARGVVLFDEVGDGVGFDGHQRHQLRQAAHVAQLPEELRAAQIEDILY